MSLESLMNLTATLQRQTVVKSTGGGQDPYVWTIDEVAVDVPCSVQPASASTQVKYMQRQMVVTHSLYFLEQYNVRVGNRWLVEDLAGNTRVFRVAGWLESIEWNDSWTCDAEEIWTPDSVNNV